VTVDVHDPRDRGRIDPLIVAALVNWNEAVGVIDKPWTIPQAPVSTSR
jgi:hypothetical protein